VKKAVMRGGILMIRVFVPLQDLFLRRRKKLLFLEVNIEYLSRQEGWSSSMIVLACTNNIISTTPIKFALKICSYSIFAMVPLQDEHMLVLLLQLHILVF